MCTVCSYGVKGRGCMTDISSQKMDAVGWGDGGDGGGVGEIERA